MAQFGSVLALGARGHRFEPGHPDMSDGFAGPTTDIVKDTGPEGEREGNVAGL